MTQEDDELVKRLLDETGIYQSSCFGCFKGFENYEYSCIGNGPDCIDSIKLLKKTRKRLWNNNKEAASTITRLNAENERLVKLISAVPPVVIEPEIEKILLRIETPTRENVANGTTVVYTPKPDVLWVCAAYRKLRSYITMRETDLRRAAAELAKHKKER